MLADVSSGVVTDCAFAAGASFTGVTVIETTAGALVNAAEVPSPVSVTVKLKASGPL